MGLPHLLEFLQRVCQDGPLRRIHWSRPPCVSGSAAVLFSRMPTKLPSSYHGWLVSLFSVFPCSQELDFRGMQMAERGRSSRVMRAAHAWCARVCRAYPVADGCVSCPRSEVVYQVCLGVFYHQCWCGELRWLLCMRVPLPGLHVLPTPVRLHYRVDTPRWSESSRSRI